MLENSGNALQSIKRGRRRGFNFQGHGKPFTDRKGDGVAGKCPSPKEKIKRHSETQDGFQILLR